MAALYAASVSALACAALLATRNRLKVEKDRQVIEDRLFYLHLVRLGAAR